MELYVIIVGYFIGMLIWSRKNIIFNNIIFGTNNKIKGLRVGFSHCPIAFYLSSVHF